MNMDSCVHIVGWYSRTVYSGGIISFESCQVQSFLRNEWHTFASATVPSSNIPSQPYAFERYVFSELIFISLHYECSWQCQDKKKNKALAFCSAERINKCLMQFKRTISGRENMIMKHIIYVCYQLCVFLFVSALKGEKNMKYTTALMGRFWNE